MQTFEAMHECAPDEVVPSALRVMLRWDHRHDAAAGKIAAKYSLRLPRDRELIRQLAFLYVANPKTEDGDGNELSRQDH